jgi:hypothetical protein
MQSRKRIGTGVPIRKPRPTREIKHQRINDAISSLVDERMALLREEILVGLKSQEKLQNSRERILGGKKDKDCPRVITKKIRRDPRDVEKWYKKSIKDFEEPTPKHYVTKESSNHIRDMIDDLERLESPLEELTSQIESHLDGPEKSKILYTLNAIQRLVVTSGARANYRLWKAVASNVAPHVPTQGHMRELLEFWESKDLNAFTANLQELEAAQAQVKAMQKIADMPNAAVIQKRKTGINREGNPNPTGNSQMGKNSRDMKYNDKPREGRTKGETASRTSGSSE